MPLHGPNTTLRTDPSGNRVVRTKPPTVGRIHLGILFIPLSFRFLITFLFAFAGVCSGRCIVRGGFGGWSAITLLRLGVGLWRRWPHPVDADSDVAMLDKAGRARRLVALS
jgi:hypothetical protein